MPKPVCVACQRFYRPKRNGTAWIECMPVSPGHNTTPGTSHPELWKPYKLWLGDVWKCHGCGHELIAGTGSRPIAEHYEYGFNDEIKLRGATIRVNDC